MSKPLRVVAVHTSFSLYWPARLEALSRRLQAAGGELHVVEVTSDAGPYVFANGSALSVINGRASCLFGNASMTSLKPAAIAARVWDALDSIQPDVVLAGAIAFTPGATAVRWCRSRRRGVVIMDDARLSDVPRSTAINAIKRRVYANVDAMLVPAPSHRDTCTFFGVDADRVFYGVDVVDNDRIAAGARTHREQNSRTLGDFEFPRRCFVGVSRQVPVKNLPFLIDGYARYRKRSDDPWDLVLIGEGTERAVIESRITSQNISGVHLRPFCKPDEIPLAFANATCLVMPSLMETWGLVVNEAMAAGVPVLVSSTCGCAETLVQEGVNGWTFSPHSRDELAGRMSAISSLDSMALKQMGDASRTFISAWSLERFAGGAAEAINCVAPVRRGFASVADRLLLSVWKGRFQPV